MRYSATSVLLKLVHQWEGAKDFIFICTHDRILPNTSDTGEYGHTGLLAVNLGVVSNILLSHVLYGPSNVFHIEHDMLSDGYV